MFKHGLPTVVLALAILIVSAHGKLITDAETVRSKQIGLDGDGSETNIASLINQRNRKQNSMEPNLQDGLGGVGLNELQKDTDGEDGEDTHATGLGRGVEFGLAISQAEHEGQRQQQNNPIQNQQNKGRLLQILPNNNLNPTILGKSSLNYIEVQNIYVYPLLPYIYSIAINRFLKQPQINMNNIQLTSFSYFLVNQTYTHILFKSRYYKSFGVYDLYQYVVSSKISSIGLIYPNTTKDIKQNTLPYSINIRTFKRINNATFIKQYQTIYTKIIKPLQKKLGSLIFASCLNEGKYYMLKYKTSPTKQSTSPFRISTLILFHVAYDKIDQNAYIFKQSRIYQ